MDQDLAFADPVVAVYGSDGTHSRTTHYFANVRNIFYCFPQAAKKLNSSARNQFLAIIPEVVLLEWLRFLYRRNET